MTVTRTIEIWADTKGRARCTGRTCGQMLTWAEIVKSGKKMCFTGDPRPLRTEKDFLTGRTIEALPFDANHWATCPDRRSFGR